MVAQVRQDRVIGRISVPDRARRGLALASVAHDHKALRPGRVQKSRPESIKTLFGLSSSI